MFSFNVEINTQQGRSITSAFSMSINTGDKIALIGEEGNGKTTFLKTLLGTQSDNFKVKLEIGPGNIIFGLVKQSIVGDELELSFLEYVLENDWSLYGDLKATTNEVLNHLEEIDFDRKLSSFSNGELVRIQIVKLLLKEVDCFLMDEPSNDLDLDSILWLEAWLQNQSKPIIMVSHDQRLIQNFANRILHFEQTHRKTKSVVTIFEGSYDNYVESRGQLISKHNQNHSNAVKEKKKQEMKWQKIHDKVSASLQATKGNNPEKGRLLAKKMKNVKSQKRNIDREVIGEHREQEESIRLSFYDQPKIYDKEIFSVDYEILSVNNRVLAKNVHLSMRSKDKIALIGRNGVGKSTFLKKLASEFDVNIMHQNYALNLDYELTAVENLWQDGKVETKTLVSNHLGSLNFTPEEMNVPVGRLSEGQKAKCSLLKVVLENTNFIILDEPTRNLSPLSVSVVYDLINDFPGAVIAVTHDRSFIDHCFSNIIELTENGFVKHED